jgi:uncharacterized protein involved in exopolysaccharide biosynthesis
MVRYLETFYRHRRLLLVPVVLILVVTAVVLKSQPPSYVSTARLWVQPQTPLVPQNSAYNPYLTPAQNEAADLTELLGTEYFSNRVARSGPLYRYLASRPVVPSLLSRLEAHLGLGGQRTHLPTRAEIDATAYSLISKQVQAVAAGPQIVEVTFTFTDPVVAAGTAEAVVQEFIAQSLATQRAQETTAVAFYQQQVKQAQSDLAAADARVNAYLDAHPDERNITVIPDARLTQLQRADDDAQQQYQDVLDKLNQAEIDQQALNAPGASGFQILDPAQVPTSPTLSKTRLVEALGAGFGFGLLVLILGLVVLTLADTTVRHPEDLEQALDLVAVGTVPELAPRRRARIA